MPKRRHDVSGHPPRRSPSQPEDPPSPPPKPRWQAISAWALVVVAIIPLLLIVFAPQDLPPEPGQSPASATPEAAFPASNTVRFAPDFDFTPPPELEIAGAESPETPSPSSSPSPSLRPGLSPDPSPTPSAQRSRRTYRTASSSTAPAPVLAEFEVFHAGRRIEFRDQDGSVYRGQVMPLLNPQGPPGSAWTCEVRGTNLSLHLPIAIAGNFQPLTDPPPALPPNAPSPDSTVPSDTTPTASPLDLPFTATLLIQGREPVEIRAFPAER